MSRNRKNNHYHYAEKYSDREARRTNRAYFTLAPVVFALLVLFAFGCVSTTFSVFVASPESSITMGNGLRVAIRTRQVDNPLADTAAVADDEVNSPVLVDENGETINPEPEEETEPIPVYTRKNDLADTGAKADLAETGIAFSDTSYIYVKQSPSSWNWWDNDDAGRLYLFGSDTLGPINGTVVTLNSVKYKRFTVTAGTYTKFILTRSYSNNDWQQQTGDMDLSSTKNMVSDFSQNGTSPTFGTVHYSSNASLAASSTNITTAQTSTLTPSLSSNTDYNVLKSTSYSVTRNSGSGTGSVSNGVFSATGAGSYTVTATVTYNAKGYSDVTGTATATKNITVTQASNPAASSVSLSASPTSNIYSGETAVTYTASATGAVSGVTYNFKIDGSSVQNTSATTYTTTYASAGTYSVTVTVEKSTYDSVTSSAVTTTVTNRPSVYFKKSQSTGTAAVNEAGTAMTYDATLGKYKLDVDLDYGSSGNWYYLVIYDASESADLSYNGGTLTETLLTGSGFQIYSGTNNTNNPMHIVASVTGTYHFYFDATNNKIYVECPHTVSFNMKSHGSQVASQVVSYGGKATQPTAPTAIGYNFGGWYKETGLTNQWNFSTDTVTSDTTLYAKWTAKTTTVTLNKQSGTGGTNSVTATYGQAMPSITKPTRTGYTFGGYYTGTGGSGTQYYNSTPASAKNWDIEDATKTLYAKWTATTYYIYLYPDNGTISSGWTWSSTNSRYSKSYNITTATITLPTPTRDGYTFDGWFTEASDGTQVTQVAQGSTGNKTYYAHWTRENYTITLHHYVSPITANASGTTLTPWTTSTGLTVVAANASQTQVQYNVQTSEITLPVESEFTNGAVSGTTPCGFVGWYTNSSFTGSAVTTVPTNSTGNKEYWAKWTPKKIVRFYNNVTGAQIGDTQYITDGQNATAPTAPTMTGFTFSQWYCADTASPTTGAATYTGVTQNRNIYAEYSIASPSFTLTLTGTFVTPDEDGDGVADYTPNGTSAYPYIAEFGTTLTGDGAITSTYASGSTVINYKWKGTGDADYSAYSSSTTFRSAALETTKTILKDDAIDYELRAMASYTGANGRTFESPAGSVVIRVKFYGVNSPIRSFEFSPVQRIYKSGVEANDPTNLLPAVTGKISANTPESYQVVIRMFSRSALDYEVVDEKLATRTGGSANFAVDANDATQIVRNFKSDLFDHLNSTGVKYFRMDVEYPDSGDFEHDSSSDTISAAFGTNESVVTRPLYFKSTTAVNGRLMIFYTSDGSIKYQTAQIVSSNTYRFMIPETVTQVYFAIADTDKEYVIPESLSSFTSASSYCTDGYYTAVSSAITINEATQACNCSGINTTTHVITINDSSFTL